MKVWKTIQLVAKDFAKSNVADFLFRATIFAILLIAVGVAVVACLTTFTDGVFEDDVALGTFFEAPKDIFSLLILGALTVSAFMAVGLVLVLAALAVYHVLHFFKRLPRTLRQYRQSIKDRLANEV